MGSEAVGTVRVVAMTPEEVRAIVKQEVAAAVGEEYPLTEIAERVINVLETVGDHEIHFLPQRLDVKNPRPEDLDKAVRILRDIGEAYGAKDRLARSK
jgi:dissimilatory sulfite reductase (desulfoviridin) alpha/beta subunit